jgi:hypothetical protein
MNCCLDVKSLGNNGASSEDTQAWSSHQQPTVTLDFETFTPATFIYKVKISEKVPHTRNIGMNYLSERSW